MGDAASVNAPTPGPTPAREGTVRARDGRAIGFAEWGAPGGLPVLAFHGGPGSRLLGVGGEAAATELGIRLVCLERPGFGRSDPAPARALVDWADDVTDAARGLEMDRLAVVGVSGGAPYALLCGARLPELVRCVGVIGGPVPPELRADDEFLHLLARDPRAAESAVRRHLEAMAADVDASVSAMATGPGPDQVVNSRPDVQESFRRTRREAFRAGVEGAVLDLLLVHRPWGFELGDIAVETHWWHGSLDPVVPLAYARSAIAEIRRVELTVYENEGHAIGFTHGAEILAALVSSHR